MREKALPAPCPEIYLLLLNKSLVNVTWFYCIFQTGSSRVRKRRLSLVQAAATSPKKMKLSEEELDKMEESISRQKQLDDEGETESNLSEMEIGED